MQQQRTNLEQDIFRACSFFAQCGLSVVYPPFLLSILHAFCLAHPSVFCLFFSYIFFYVRPSLLFSVVRDCVWLTSSTIIVFLFSPFSSALSTSSFIYIFSSPSPSSSVLFLPLFIFLFFPSSLLPPSFLPIIFLRKSRSVSASGTPQNPPKNKQTQIRTKRPHIYIAMSHTHTRLVRSDCSGRVYFLLHPTSPPPICIFHY